MTGIFATLAAHMYAVVHCDWEGKLTTGRRDIGTGLTGRSALGTGKIATRSHSSQIPNMAHPMRLPRRHRSRRFIWYFWCTWWRCKAPFAGVGAPRKVCESRDQRRMTSSENEPWESPGTCSSEVIDSFIIRVLHIVRYVGRSEAEACQRRSITQAVVLLLRPPGVRFSSVRKTMYDWDQTDIQGIRMRI